MPRYFFDTLNGEHVVDRDGEVLLDNESARQAAIRVVSELTPMKASHLWAGDDFKVVIRDENGIIGFLTVMATRIP
ncbi:MAG: hypothetical protein DCF30_21920 [Hyphomicrobiales bacterium]|nr:MAG: hypothetical protein DCF30_21920 [Hyphomicrobiales bacterium]